MERKNSPITIRSKEMTADKACPVAMEEKIKTIDKKAAKKATEAVLFPGTALFMENDLKDARNILALMIRYLVVRDHITEEKFIERHERLAMASNLHVNKRTYERYNTLKGLKNERLTWDFVEKFLQILGYRIVDMELTLRDECTKEVSFIRKSTILKMLDKPQHEVSIAENEAAEASYKTKTKK